MAAPSFSSFPSFDSFPESDPGPSRGRSTSPSKSKRKDEKPRKDKHKGDKDKRKRDKHYSEKLNQLVDHSYSSRGVVQSDERLKADEDRQRKDTPIAFYTDRKGDRLNIRYGGLHASDVPKYRLVGNGRKIMGLNHAWTAVSRSNKGVEISVGSRRRMPALTDPSSRALLAAAPTRSMVGSDTKYKCEEMDGFLRLPSRRGQHVDQPYGEITLVKNESDSESSSASSDSISDEDSDSSPLTSHQRTLKTLEQQITSDPSSIMTWLSLLSQTLSTVPHTSKSAEITLSILLRAISSHPQNRTSKVLRLKYLKAGEQVWHESKLRAEWEDALKVGGVEIWMEWLEWRIRQTVRGVNGVVEDGERVLHSLGDGEDDEIGKLRVLWRVAVALQNAGYTERATALFQAQAELTFEAPQPLYGLPLNTLLDALEEFWESEVPRVGELGAKGWAAWVSSSRPDYIPSSSPKSRLVPASQDLTDPYSRWCYEETRADQTQRIPARSTDDNGDVDPYATILFSDNRPLLIPLQTIRAKNAFRLIWLSLLGLHIPGLSKSLSADSHGNWDDRWSFTHLTSPAYFTSIFPSSLRTHITSDSQAGVLVGREKQYSSGFGPVKHWNLGVLAPLENTVNAIYGLWTKEEVLGVDDELVRRVFEQLRWGPEDFEWDCYALAFEAALSVKSALKLSRSFLSDAKDSLPHWATYARLERLRGRIDDARKVYQTVLTASRLSATQTCSCQLWWDWAEMEWLAGKQDAALGVILRSVDVEGTAGIMILRAKRNLEDKYKSSKELPWKAQEAWIKLHGLLELLTSTPATMLLSFDSHLLGDGNFVQNTTCHESLTVASLLMLYHHGMTLRNATPPSLLRDRAEKAVEAYPSNTIIFGMFLEAQKGQGVWGRVRGLLGDTTANGLGKDKDVPRRVAEVWVANWEGRWEAERERTRSGLAAALGNERTQGSPIIWRMFLEFEIRTGELQRAKKMLYAAIGECPLVKELYLLAFGPLRSIFNARELNAFADTMAERELRLRKGLYELLEGWEEDTTEKNADDSDSADELEYNISEL